MAKTKKNIDNWINMKKSFKFYSFLALALLWGVLFYFGTVWTMGRANDIYVRYKYPLKYAEEIGEYSNEFGLEPSLVSAVIYEESRFRSNSNSNKGAVGLMQLLPETADYIAERLRDSGYSPENIADINQNIRYGCYYLSYLYGGYGEWDKALAAYNAGEGNVDMWLAEGDYEVRFEETRNFVERVKRTQEVYERIYFSNN